MQNDGSGFLRTNTFPTTSFLISPPTLLSAFSWAALSDLFLPLHANQKHQSHPSNSIVSRAGRPATARRGQCDDLARSKGAGLPGQERKLCESAARGSGEFPLLAARRRNRRDGQGAQDAVHRRRAIPRVPRGGSSLGPWRRRRTATTTCPISPRPTSGTRLPSIPAAPGSSRRRVGRRRRRRHPAEGGRRATACRAG